MKAAKQRIYTKTERILLSILLVSASLGACVFVSVTYVLSSNRLVEKIADVALHESTALVESWIATKGETISTIAAGIAAQQGREEGTRAFLAGVLGGDSDFIDIFYGSAEPPSRRGFASYGSGWRAPEGYDWTTRPWFLQALAKEGVVVSAPYKDLQTGKIIVSISMQVRAGGRMIGVVSSDISTQTVRRIIEGNYIAAGSTIALVNEEGDYIEFGESRAALAGNAFGDGALLPWKARILAGEFLIRSSSITDRYVASIGLPRLGWVMLASGPLSTFEDIRWSTASILAVILFLDALFLAMLVRSWRTSNQLRLATDTIAETNRGLERVVEERTASLRNILDNAEEGFFTFGSSLVVDPSYSKGCLGIFGKEIGGQSVPDVLFPGRSDTIADFRQGFELYFSGKSKAGIIIDLTEKQTSIRDRIIEISYKETAGQRILCILADVTLARASEEKGRAEAAIQKRILRALNNKHSFARFLESADDLFARLEVYAGKAPSGEEAADFARALHGFKGDAGFFAFDASQELAHEAETLLGDSRLLGTEVSYKEMLSQLRKAYYRELRAITDAMGEKWLEEASGITMPRDAFRKLVLYVLKKTPDDARLLSFLDSFRKIPVSELFTRLAFVAATTAERLGKKVAPMAIVGGEQKIVPDRYQGLAEACIHLVNNMVDHGIEYPYEREAIQKPPEGRIQLAISMEKAAMILEFRDDGRGINPREIELVAREKGLIPEGRSLQSSELFALLFADGFSTRKEASMTSGRGVGLAAVKAEVAKLGGAIEVRSKLGKGSSFEITIPLAARNSAGKEHS